jgi:hypothetical protein
MRQFLSLGLIVAVTLLALAFAMTPASAETVNCTVISSVPFTITSPGIYCLRSDLNLSTSNLVNAITIDADNVVLDLNGHVLSNTGGGLSTAARGVYGTVKHRDITVKNGTIRTFRVCVLLDETFPATDNRTHIVEDLKLENCRAQGINVIGRASTVRRNVVRDTTGGTLDEPHFGIIVNGRGSQVYDNLVHHVDRTATFLSVGIAVGDVDVTVVNNRVSNVDQGIFFFLLGTSGVYRDNLVTSAGTPYFDQGVGVDAGNNFP